MSDVLLTLPTIPDTKLKAIHITNIVLNRYAVYIFDLHIGYRTICQKT